MAPEQFQGRAVFASDVYAIGITMYQMLTGVLPYETPTPRDLERIISGELVVAPRLKNPKIPKAINDIVLKALAPDLAVRYPRAAELLHDIVAVQSRKTRTTAPAPTPLATSLSRSAASAAPVGRLREDSPADIQDRVKARDTPEPRFCWQCRKALASRADHCPFCGEKQ